MPLPVPGLPDTMVIHESFFVAVQAHVLNDAVTAMVPGPPEEAKASVAGLGKEKVHVGGVLPDTNSAQSVPFHCQVLSGWVLLLPSPPKKTATIRTGS